MWETKPIALSSRPDQQRREPHEGDDLADARLAVHMQNGAEHEDRDDADGGCGPRQHGHDRPPVQHRELVVEHLADDVAEHPRLGAQAGEGLHHHDVGQRVLRIAGEARMELFHLRLRVLRAPDDDGGDDHEDHHEHHQQQAEPPVHHQRQRQQHDQRAEGDDVLAEETEPQAEQVVRAHRA